MRERAKDSRYIDITHRPMQRSIKAYGLYAVRISKLNKGGALIKTRVYSVVEGLPIITFAGKHSEIYITSN